MRSVITGYAAVYRRNVNHNGILASANVYHVIGRVNGGKGVAKVREQSCATGVGW